MELEERTRDGFGGVKALALFFGMKDLTDGRDPLNPSGLMRAGFSGARNLYVESEPIRVPSQYNAEKCEQSPLEFDGTKIANSLTGGIWRTALPEVSLSDAKIKYLLPTLTETAGVMVFPGCVNFDRGAQCKFCTAGTTDGKLAAKPKEVVAEIKFVRERGLPIYSVSLNTGQMPDGCELNALASCANEIKRYDSSIAISAEVWPDSIPSDLRKFSGVIDLFQVNLELASDFARRELCPAKPDQKTYFRTFEKLLKEGFDVSSVLQMNYYFNLEPLDGVARAMKQMLDMGVVPELLVSRSVKGSKVNDGFFGAATTLEENFARFEEFLARVGSLTDEFGGRLQKASGKISAGCVKCGMCNLNKSPKNWTLANSSGAIFPADY